MAYKETVKERNDKPGTVMQKYGEIYGHQTCRQISWLDGERDQVVNIVEQRKKKMTEKDAEKERKRVEREAKKVLNNATSNQN